MAGIPARHGTRGVRATAHHRTQESWLPARAPSRPPCHKAPGQWPSKSGLKSEGQPHPRQPGNPREGIQPAFLCWNRGKLCSSSPLPFLHWVRHGWGLGEGWVGEAAGQSLSPVPAADMLFLQPGTSGNIPRHGPASPEPPLLILQSCLTGLCPVTQENKEKDKDEREKEERDERETETEK